MRALVLLWVLGACPYIGEVDGDGDGVVANVDCDDGDPSLGGPQDWYQDLDGDGWGAVWRGTGCEAPDAGSVLASGDCDDGDPAVNPGATEAWYDGVDQDCDGNDDDRDGDGYGAVEAGGTDCEDDLPDVHPGVPEVCGDGLDNDCDGRAEGCGPGGTLVLDQADARLIGMRSTGHVGFTAETADINFDGTPEILAGAFQSPNAAGEDNAGVVYLLEWPLGGDVDLETGSLAIWEGGAPSQGVGRSVAPLDDADHDLRRDIAIGAETATVGSGESVGAVYVLGNAAGGGEVEVAARLSVYGATDGDYVGKMLAGNFRGAAGAGPWMVISADGWDGPGGTDAGAIFLYPQEAVGIDVLPGSADYAIYGEFAEGNAGRRLATGDLDGDGVDDILTSAHFGSTDSSDPGRVYAVRGPVESDLDLQDAELALWGSQNGDGLGDALAIVGDVDGDGYADVALGAPTADPDADRPNAGLVHLFAGPIGTGWSLGGGVARFEGAREGDDFGISVAGVDVNGDGLVDLVMGADWEDTMGNRAGAAYVFYGPRQGAWVADEADAVLLGESADDKAGRMVQSAGDIDGDGYEDILVGAWQSDIGTPDGGAIYLLLGGAGL